MAVRLQVKLGIVAEAERLEDSPDTTLVVEPPTGSVVRSKGNLYAIVSALGTGRRLQEATRLVAETIRNDYYYDESAGIAVCLEKTLRSANKKLAHGREKLGLGSGDAPGPLGTGIAVVRGNELYVVTIGPVEAYLVRRASLLTLPDVDRSRGLPLPDLHVSVWRGEVVVGDSLTIVSTNVSQKLGLDELKDAMVTLHPQSAMEHIHHRFIAAGGTGSDGAMAIEITEVSSTHRQRALVSAQADEPLAGAPERSPIPLADSVTGGVAAVQAGAKSATSAAGNVFVRGFHKFQDLLPHRSTRYRRVRPAATRRETQRRAAIAVLAFVALIAGLGLGVFAFGGQNSPAKIEDLTEGQRALGRAKENVRLVFDNGVNLVTGNEDKARSLLTEAYEMLETAAKAGIPESTLAPIRARVLAGLDTLYNVVPVAAAPVFTFPTAAAADIAALVHGPDGAPFVIDRATKTVYRIDVKTNKAAPILKAGATVSAVTAGEPRFLSVDGPDLVILDSKNNLFRWRAADRNGKGTLARIRIPDSSRWGADVRAIGTYLRSAESGLYNFYVVDPSEQQVLVYTPAADGSGFPSTGTGRLATATDVSTITSMLIDADIYLAGGSVTRYINGKTADWKPGPPPDSLLRKAPDYKLVASSTAAGRGNLYLYDSANGRVVAVDKGNGEYVAQYRVAKGGPSWSDLRGIYVVSRGEDLPPVLWWADGTRIGSAPLDPVADVAPGSSPSASPGASGSPGATPKPTKKPAPKPTKKP